MNQYRHEHRVQTICLLILSAVAIAASLYWTQPVMVPFVLAIFLAILLSPLIELQVRTLRLPRALAVASALTLGYVFLGLVGWLVYASVEQMAENADVYQKQIEGLFERLTSWFSQSPFGRSAEAEAGGGASDDPIFGDVGEKLGGLVVGVINTIVNLLSQGILVMIFLVFLLLSSTETNGSATVVIGEIVDRVKRYLYTKLATSAVTGILVGGILAALDVQPALAFGLFAFLLNFIPNIGSIISCLLPLPVVLVSPEISVLTAVLAIALPGAIQFTVGNLLEPKWMGSSLDLHPVVVLMGLIFWGSLWGLVGALLATPLTAVVKILLEKLDFTAPVAGVMAGRLGRDVGYGTGGVESAAGDGS